MSADDIDAPELVELFQQPPERRALETLEHIMMNLTDLPRWACDASPLQHSALRFPVYIACVDSYFTNARLAAEFFVKMPRADITARSFVPDWEPPPVIGRRMERVWLMASKHIVHLSQDRVLETPADWRQEDISFGALMRITRDAFQVLVFFTDAYERHGGAHAEYLRDLYVGTRPRTKKELGDLRRPNRKPPPVIIEWW
ncbi:hypothetical protein [Mycobacteroides abscessus]|uniref:hypothetical protein n=1 Tax=Mycobacteroides abscessus TaxID=36809 RepID=UPI0013000261|nr:hypothetical protein [Mycobacteroides abscessus]